MKFFKRSGKKYFRIIMVVVCASLLGGIAWTLLHPTESAAAWYNTTWTQRKLLTIDHTKVSGGSDLTNFPVLINLSDSALNSAQSSGNDIVFTASDGTTKLSHDIEKFTQSSGNIIAWVKIPTLSASTDTNIYLYWGNSGASDQQDATNVWDTNYRGVWHLSEGSGTTSTDKTSYANNLTLNTASWTSGKIDGAWDGDGIKWFNQTADDDDFDFTASENFTVSLWFKSDSESNPAGNEYLFSKGGNNNIGYFLRIGSSGNGKVAFGSEYTGDGSSDDSVSSTDDIYDAQWHYITAVKNGTTSMLLYVDGNLNDTDSAITNSTLDNTQFLRMGDLNGSDDDNEFVGDLDEPRVARTNRTAGWIATEYANQNSPSTFFSQSKVEQKNAPVLYWKFDEGNGTSANDSSSNSNTGTLAASSATPAWQTEDLCVSGKCLKFDASDDYLSRTYSTDTDLDVGTAGFSVSAWIKHPINISGTDVVLSRFSSGGYILYMNSSGFICFGIDDDATSFPEDSACSTNGFADNQWHLVQAVKSGTSSITVYVDGKQVAQDASLSATGSLSGSSPALYVGAESTSLNIWDGYIDEVKIYDYAKTADQIKTEFITRGSVQGASINEGTTALERSLSQDLIGYWKMDEAAANTCSGGTNDNCDSSGLGNDLNWTNEATTATGKFGNGVVFDGDNDSTQRSTGLFSGINATKRWAVSLWFKTTDTQGYLYDTRGTDGFALYTDGSDTLKIYYFQNNTVKDITYSATSTDGNWHHTVMTRDADNSISLFVDGQKLTPTAYTTNDDISALSDTIGNIYFGNRHASNIYPLSGTIDEARVYKRAVSESEVRALYDWAPGPVGHWKMDESSWNGTSGEVKDSSGTGNNGTATGGLSTTNAKFGNGGNFDGSNDYISIGDPSDGSLDMGTGEFTASAWVKTSTTGARTYIFDKKGGGSNEAGYHLFLQDDNTFCIRIANGSAQSSICTSTAINNGNWHFVTGKLTRGTTDTLYLYVDGIQVASGNVSVAGWNISGTEVFNIGANSGVLQFWNGQIDNLQIYNYARTSKQIVSDMNAGRPSSTAPLGYWKFDEGQGTTVNNSGSQGSILNGTTSNMAAPATSTSGWGNNGKFGKAVIFDNDNDVISMGSDSSIDNIPALSVSAWVKPNSSGENNVGRIVDKTTGPNTVGWALLMDSNNINFSVNYSTSPLTVITSATVPSSTWSYVTATWDGTANASGVSIYINGKKQASFVQNDSGSGSRNDDAAANLYVGNVTAGTRTFDGAIDEVKLYNYVLTADEVALDMNQGKSQIMGATSTSSDGTTPDSSSAREFCVPGDTTSCSAPIGEWNFEEGSGSVAKDTSGNNNNISAQNSPVRDVGKIGSAPYFDGTDDYYCSDTDSNGTCDVNTALQLNGSLTINYWVNAKTTSANDRMIHVGENTELQNDNTQYSIYWDITSGNDITYTHEDGAGVNSTVTFDTNLSLNTWYYISVTRDIVNNEISLYVNGKLISTGTYTNDPDGGSNGKFAIGNQYGSSGYFNGKIDGVKIYNYERTAAQIAWDYNHGGPVGWWKFDECSGSTASDASGNGYHGTVTIGATGTYSSIGNCNSGTSSESRNAGTIGKYSSAIGLDGTDDWIGGLGDILDMGTGDFTLSAWINRTNLSNGVAVIGKKNGGLASQTGYQLYCSNSTTCTAYLADGTNQFTVSGQINQAGDWEHLVAVIGRGANANAKIYVNGKDVTSSRSGTVSSITSANNATSLRLGSLSNDSNPFEGKLDDIRIYNYALTDLQVRTLYNENSAVRFGQ